MADAVRIILSKVALKLAPALYKRRAIAWAEKHLKNNASFLLSFDCDTSRDADASVKIQRQLHRAGIRAAYAIPGQLLEKHWDKYKELLSLGGYFINHGYREHAAVDPTTGKPYSTFTYRDIDKNTWQQDILAGHETIASLTGEPPIIFRTPHFGEFNNSNQLRQLYDFLSSLNYKISTSTTPAFSFSYGPIHKPHASITEIPLSGCLGRPTQLMDSWGFLSAPDAAGRQALLNELNDYKRELAAGKRFLVNIYFDPADIASDQEILDLLTSFKPYCNIHYDNLVQGKQN